jgi:hypothetical protein
MPVTGVDRPTPMRQVGDNQHFDIVAPSAYSGSLVNDAECNGDVFGDVKTQC